MNELVNVENSVNEQKWYTIEELAEWAGYSSAHSMQSNFGILELLNRFSNSNDIKMGGYHNTRKYYSKNVLKAIKEYQISNGICNALKNKEVTVSGNVSYIQNDTIGKTIDALLNNPEVTMLILQKSLEKNIKLSTENKELKEVIEVQKPKVEFYDTVTKSETTFDMSEVAKVINIPKIGRNKIFEILRNKGILRNNNQPYQKYVNSGYFKIIENETEDKNGYIHVNTQTVVFQKGLDFIIKALKDEGFVPSTKLFN